MASSAGISRKVRPVITVNGVMLPESAVISLETTSNSHFTADTFRVELATKGLPMALNSAYWADSQGDQVSVAVSIDDAAPFQLVFGQVDDVEEDFTGTTISLTGRDLSAPLIDNTTAEKFQNKKSHEIAQILALRRGLDSAVTETTTIAGKYYEIDHAVLTRQQTEWDLLVYLAEQEGFDVYVTGTTLHFEPSQIETTTPYVLLGSRNPDGSFVSNATSLNARRSQTLAKDVLVVVKSWNQKQQKDFYAEKHVHRKGVKAGKPQVYSFTRPNLTQDQAVKLAASLAEQITRHERVIAASLPGDNVLSTRTLIRLVGTGTAYDQLYYPDSIHRRLSREEGYRMEVRAKNHSTISDAVL